MTRRRSAVRVCPCLPTFARPLARPRSWQAAQAAESNALSERAAGVARESKARHRRNPPSCTALDMSEITVTLPDGSSRRVPAGTTPGDVAAAISPRLAKAALAAWSTTASSISRYPLEQDARVRIVTTDSPEALALYRHSTAHLMAAAVTHLFPGAQCGIGPATDDGFFYDFVVDRAVRAGGPRGDREEDEGAGRRRTCVYERQMWPRDEAKRSSPPRGEPLKVQLIEEKTAGPGRGLLLHDQGSRHLRRFLRRPARAVDRPAQGVQAAEHVERLLEGRRAEPADAARSTARRSSATAELKAHLQRIEEAKKRDHRKVGKELGLFMFHQWAPGATVLARQGHDALQHARQLHARACCFPPGYVEVQGAARLQQGAVGDVRPLAALPREHVPRRDARTRSMGLKAMNCPGPHADVRQRGAQLPRSAAAVPRADAAAPQRGLGRAVAA